MISDNPNNDALNFIEVLSSLAQKLSLEELVYWGRNREQLYMKLKLAPIEFLQELIDEKTIVPAQPQAVAKEMLCGGPFVQNHLSFGDSGHFKYEYKATLVTEVMPYLFAYGQSREEILRAIDDDGKQVALTPQQIHNLCVQQNQRGRSGPLSLDTPTYCFIETKRNRAELFRLFWNKSVDYPLAKNRWCLSSEDRTSGGRILFAV
jgi:hypothetical protein